VVKLFDTDNDKPRIMWNTIFMTMEARKNLACRNVKVTA